MPYYKRIAIVPLFAVVSSLAIASDLSGTFKGEEQLTVSRCISKTSASPWQATFVVDGDTYTGSGTSTDGGQFQFKGKLDGNTATGTVEGRTPESRLWEGKTQATVSPEGLLTMQVDGKVPTVNCEIAVKIKANKTGKS